MSAMKTAAMQAEYVDMTAATAEHSCNTAVISWPGYGILFFWQLGVLQYLEETYDLSRTIMVGSSAGSMLSVLAACEVKPQAALDLAHQLCLKHGVFDRPLGLMGVWGGIVREWLDLLLPADAADRCMGRVRVVITTLPFFQREVITKFTGRADLIECCLASSHIPFFMDWRASAECKGRRCVDGSMVYILTGKCSGLRPLSHLSSLLLFDPFSDRQLLQGWNILCSVLLCGKEGAQQLLNQGFAHVAGLDQAGALTVLSPYKRAPVTPGAVDSNDANEAAALHELQQTLQANCTQVPSSCMMGLELCSNDSSSSSSSFFADAVAIVADTADCGKK